MDAPEKVERLSTVVYNNNLPQATDYLRFPTSRILRFRDSVNILNHLHKNINKTHYLHLSYLQHDIVIYAHFIVSQTHVHVSHNQPPVV